MTPNTEPLIPDETYHIYNRSNGDELLFKNQENYRYFLELYKKYTAPIAETFCYCLMAQSFSLFNQDEGLGIASTMPGLQRLRWKKEFQTF